MIISEYTADLYVYLFASIVKYLHFFKHSITTYKSTSLSIACCRCLIAWLEKFFKEWASNILTSRLPANFSLDEKIRRHSQLLIVFVGKDNTFKRKMRCKGLYFLQLNSSYNLFSSLRLTFARSIFIFCLVRSVSTFEAKSSVSASSSSFILTEARGDLFNKPIFVRADNWLKYRAICCSINQPVLDNISGRCCLLNSIFGKPH